MISSLSSATLRQYNKPLKLWNNFCSKQKICPFNASICKIIEFLNLSFQNINKYTSLNTYRSAISLITNKEVGSDKNIKRFCKGAANEKPSEPKYDYTYDPKIVISYLEKLQPNENLSLEILTKKFVTLLALITAQRVQTLSKIKMENINFSADEAKIFITEKLKTSSVNRTQPILSIPKFYENEKICVFSALKIYVERTAEIRPVGCENLLLTTTKPYKAASA